MTAPPSSAEIAETLDAFRWPAGSVCGYEWCPTTGYCVECHEVAYSAMLRARRWLAEGLFRCLGLADA